jgi:hypothetical protein
MQTLDDQTRIEKQIDDIYCRIGTPAPHSGYTSIMISDTKSCNSIEGALRLPSDLNNEEVHKLLRYMEMVFISYLRRVKGGG